jgi:hypothetical protein
MFLPITAKFVVAVSQLEQIWAILIVFLIGANRPPFAVTIHHQWNPQTELPCHSNEKHILMGGPTQLGIGPFWIKQSRCLQIRRKWEMWCSQNGLCSLCNRPLYLDLLSFRHCAKRGI